MVFRLEIANRPDRADPAGLALTRAARSFLGIPVTRARTRDVYLIDADLARPEAEVVLRELVDPVLQEGALDRLDSGSCDMVLSIGYRPGVTDPVGRSARVAVEDTLGRRLAPGAAVYCSRMYCLAGVDRQQAERIGRELLANPLIHRLQVASFEEWRASQPDLTVPAVIARGIGPVDTIDLTGSPEALMAISRTRLLALNLEELQTISQHFRRAGDDPVRRQLGLGSSPTDVELESLAQTWSEHCKHKIFHATIHSVEDGRPPETIEALFDRYIRGATAAIDRQIREREGRSWLVSVFRDNAGVVRFDDASHLVFKVETHNSPSALDPYGGAITGIVGVNRDSFGTGRGADLLANVWGYCFASPAYDGVLPRGLLHPRRVRDGVHQGVIDGGNQSGIPYGRGWELFDARFLGKPLVFCGTVGALPVTIAGTPGEHKAARPGDRIVMTGGRIGADGIHGATFSSAALDESAPVQAVQIGDPITQKRMFDFLLEARDLGLYTSITDNGAGGLSSSVGEMARESGGALLDLARAPLKYEGLAPWEILVSEAQERMTLAVPPEHVDRLLALAARREVEATVLGTFTDSGHFHLTYGEATVGYLPLDLLHDGPTLELQARFRAPRFDEPPETAVDDPSGALLALLGRLNLRSLAARARHYDHEVKGLTVIKPLIGAAGDVPAEATVFLARHGDRRGFVLAEGVNPYYSDIDTHAMAGAVVDLAVRRLLCAGARLDRIALLDNFCWPDPIAGDGNADGEHKLAQLVRACRGLYEVTTAYGTPLISGKDSMKNDAVMEGIKISVPPTLLVSALGQIEDARRALTLEPRPGDLVYLLGTTRNELGASEYYRWLGERDGREAPLGSPRPYIGNAVPRLDVHETLPLYRALAEAIDRGLVRSAATPALGGLALCLARSALAGRIRLEIDLTDDALPAEALLFSESCGRFVVTVAPADAAAFAALFVQLPARRIGEVSAGQRLRIRLPRGRDVDVEVAQLVTAFTEEARDD